VPTTSTRSELDPVLTETEGSGSPTLPPSLSATTVWRWLGKAALGLTLAASSAGLAWFIRGERPSSPPPILTQPQTHSVQAEHVVSQALDPIQKRGRLAFLVHCARCHGPEGRGDGPDSAVLKPPPRDLLADRWIHGQTPDAIRGVVREGVPGTAMTGWKAVLSAQETEAVIQFLLTLVPPSQSQAPSTQRQDVVEETLIKKAGFEPIRPKTRAPSITYQDKAGHPRTLEQERGQVVILTFWGTTCAPCMKELPELNQLANTLADSRLVIRGLCVDEADESFIRDVQRTRAPDLALSADQTGLARLKYAVQTLPCSVLIDQDGNLIGRVEGGRAWSSEPIRRLLDHLESNPSGSTPQGR